MWDVCFLILFLFGPELVHKNWCLGLPLIQICLRLKNILYTIQFRFAWSKSHLLLPSKSQISEILLPFVLLLQFYMGFLFFLLQNSEFQALEIGIILRTLMSGSLADLNPHRISSLKSADIFCYGGCSGTGPWLFIHSFWVFIRILQVLGCSNSNLRQAGPRKTLSARICFVDCLKCNNPLNNAYSHFWWSSDRQGTRSSAWVYHLVCERSMKGSNVFRSLFPLNEQMIRNMRI